MLVVQSVLAAGRTSQTTFNGVLVGYDINANVSSYGSNTYVYDAQKRLKTVTNSGTTTTFKYDGLNRKISQTIGGVTTYNVWDGWNLIEERGAGNVLLNTYLYGAGEIVERINGTTPYFYFQDGLGSTSHVSDQAGNLLEAYTYGTFGRHTVYDPNGTIRKSGSSYDIRHLFTGQLWMPQAGLYDYRNRAYSPTLTRFLQPDPIGFVGDPTNLYRYCGNDPVNRTDPFGLEEPGKKPVEVWYPRETVYGAAVNGGPFDHNFTNVTTNGGLSFLGSTGSTDHFGGGSGNHFAILRAVHDSRGVGRTSAATPWSGTQGGWTYFDGTPTGSANYWVLDEYLTDRLYEMLGRVITKLADGAPFRYDIVGVAKFLGDLDSAFHNFPSSVFYYDGKLGPPAGFYYGYEINYIGIGEGSAALGLTRLEMYAGIVRWRSDYREGTTPGVLRWADVGFDFWPGHH